MPWVIYVLHVSLSVSKETWTSEKSSAKSKESAAEGQDHFISDVLVNSVPKEENGRLTVRPQKADQ